LPRARVAGDGEPEAALSLAVSRQAGRFDPDAVSSAGARGLMQILAATAKRQARRLGLAYDVYDLTADPAFNVRLGRAFLGRLIKRYDGYYPLAIAAYNAGPGRVDRWIKRFGDPRQGAVDIIDWIEMIPFAETRNYVQRVLEGLTVYRQIAGAPTRPSMISQVSPSNGWEWAIWCLADCQRQWAMNETAIR